MRAIYLFLAEVMGLGDVGVGYPELKPTHLLTENLTERGNVM